MLKRLATILACALVGLGVLGGPALAAGHNDRAKTATAAHRHHRAATTTTSSTATGSSTASTAAANQILNECQSQGRLTHDFSRAQLKKALSIMSASTNEYSNCSDVIHNALAHGIKASDINGSGGSSSSTTTIVIIIVVVLLLLAAIFGGLALRRRRGGGDGGDDAPAPTA